MPMELRKRKAPEAPPAPVKKAAKPKVEKEEKIEKPKVEKPAKVTKTPAKKPKDPSAPAPPFPEVGSTIDLEGFGGEIETNDGTKTTLKKLVDESKAGVVLFTYPKASTPGCTKQACRFRDEYGPLTAGGLAIYGLSHDTLEANTKFKTNQKLPYPLLCDPEQTLIGAIGLRKKPITTAVRGVFVVDKSGKVLAAQAGSPDGTVAVVQKIVDEAK